MGIAICVTSICFVYIMFGFKCDETVRLIMLIICGSSCASLVRSAATNAHHWDYLLYSFYFLTSTCFILVGTLVARQRHMVNMGTWQGDALLFGAIATIGIISIGSYFYNYKVPEAWYPGHYDLWGHSHQIWHMCVFLAPMATYGSLLYWNPTTCPST